MIVEQGYRTRFRKGVPVVGEKSLCSIGDATRYLSCCRLPIETRRHGRSRRRSWPASSVKRRSPTPRGWLLSTLCIGETLQLQRHGARRSGRSPSSDIVAAMARIKNMMGLRFGKLLVTGYAARRALAPPRILRSAVSSPDLDLGAAPTSARSRRLISDGGQREGAAVWTLSKGETVAFIFIVAALIAILMS